MGIDGRLEIIFMLLDLLDDREATAHRSFLLLRLPIFILPVTLAALSAIEFITLLTEVPDVFEIKLRITILTFGGLHGLLDEVFVLLFGGQVKRAVVSCIEQIDIDSLSQEALEHVNVLGGGGLMDCCVAVLVHI